MSVVYERIPTLLKDGPWSYLLLEFDEEGGGGKSM